MFIKETKMQKLISRIGVSAGVHYTEKTYNNIERILKAYRARITTPFLNDIVKRMPIELIVPKIYESFLSEEPIDYNIADQFVLNLINEPIFAGIVDNTMNNLEKLSKDNGPDYRKIIERLYCEDALPTNKDIYTELGMTRNAYNYRKIEATMAFGILFWEQLMKFWDNIEQEAAMIEEKAGRKGMMSSLCDLHNLSHINPEADKGNNDVV